MITRLLPCSYLKYVILFGLLAGLFSTKQASASPWTIELTRQAGFLLRYDRAIVGQR
ncbi:MAG: hypothetical protein KatS3mg104_0697 [Phycisphaerae bacterium]|nr:MAG: hypothetical protein KatS3mg104_0697 [Phycisphaerae bacterium]